jgi:hypothetical protein
MTQPITVDGRQVIVTTDPSNGLVTQVTFPDVHMDNLNPTAPLVITITPAMTVDAVKTQIVGPVLGANPAS